MYCDDGETCPLNCGTVRKCNEKRDTIEQQAQTIKELHSQLQAKTEECDELRAQVNELRDWVDGVRIRYQNIPPENGVEQMEFDAAMETLKRTQAQSLSAIRNEVIEECALAVKSLPVINETYKKRVIDREVVIQTIRNLKTSPQLTEEE